MGLFIKPYRVPIIRALDSAHQADSFDTHNVGFKKKNFFAEYIPGHNSTWKPFRAQKIDAFESARRVTPESVKK